MKPWLLCLLFLSGPALAGPGLFSVTGLAGWEALTFKKKTPTVYALMQDGNTQVLGAECNASASGYIAKGKIDLTKTPVLTWRWKADAIYPGINEREKGGDDFPARVYVVRDGGFAIWRTRSLVYTWSSTQPVGSDWPNPYASQAHHVALQSGLSKLGQWQTESRDLRADFKRYFGLDADTLDAVALMSDCDDFKGAARARYGDIRLTSP